MAAINIAAREQAIKGALKSALLRGESSASVYEKIKGTSIGIREQTFYKIATDVRKDVAKINSLWELPSSQVIGNDQLIKASARSSIIYSFKAHVEAYTPDGFSLGDRYITAVSESYKTKNEVKRLIEASSGSWQDQDVQYSVYDIVEAYYHGN